jgi:translocation protein SEC66
MSINSKIRENVEEIQSKMESEKAWWEKKRGQISTEFMKELDEEQTSTKPHSEDEAVLVDTPQSGKATKA